MRKMNLYVQLLEYRDPNKTHFRNTKVPLMKPFNAPTNKYGFSRFKYQDYRI